MINKISKYSLLALMISLAPMKYASTKDYHCPDPTNVTCKVNERVCHAKVDGVKWRGTLPDDKTKKVDLYTIDLDSSDPSYPKKTVARCNFKTSADMRGDYDFVTDFPIPEEDCTVSAAKEGKKDGGSVKYTCDTPGDLKGCIISCKETKT